MSELSLNKDQEQLLKCIRVASDVWRDSVEKTFPELFNTEPKEGDWAKIKDLPDPRGTKDTLVMYTEKSPFFFGFNAFDKWDDRIPAINKNKLVKADILDVEARLQLEAIIRGFIVGARFDANFCYSSIKKTDYVTVRSGPMFLTDGILTVKCLNSDQDYAHYAIFKDGCWATPVNVCTKEEAQKEFGILIVD